MAGVNKVCLFCNNEFIANSTEHKRGKALYCSRECFHNSRIGTQSPNWKGGRKKDVHGYINIYKPNHLFSDSNGYIKEHRYNMSTYLDRCLDICEVVHHCDEIRDNNDIENLELMLIGEHVKHHLKGRKLSDSHKKKLSDYRKTLNDVIERNEDGTFKKGAKYVR